MFWVESSNNYTLNTCWFSCSRHSKQDISSIMSGLLSGISKIGEYTHLCFRVGSLLITWSAVVSSLNLNPEPEGLCLFLCSRLSKTNDIDLHVWSISLIS